MDIAIVAGGKLIKRFLKEIQKGSRIIGVDRGAFWLLQNGVTPDIAIGDFDSVSKKELKHILDRVKNVMTFPKKKDATDLELAVDVAIRLKPKTVVIFGGIGSRLDHTFASIHLLEKFLEKNIDAKIIDAKNEMFLVAKEGALRKSKAHRYVSVHPITTKALVTLEGFLYPVKKKEFARSWTLGVSNEIKTKEAHITVHEGIVLVIQSRD